MNFVIDIELLAVPALGDDYVEDDDSGGDHQYNNNNYNYLYNITQHHHYHHRLLSNSESIAMVAHAAVTTSNTHSYFVNDNGRRPLGRTGGIHLDSSIIAGDHVTFFCNAREAASTISTLKL